jgi:hypothetical protein
LSWAGSPLSLHIPSLDGRINLALDAGQFLKAGPGAARLLSVLNLQALPRRLLLDFRDVFQEGFVFDNVTGDVKIDDGVAATNNLRMRGVQAAVLMEGSADIARETQNLRVLVVPEINAGTASLAYAVINPAIGLGSFLAQMFLRRPLMAASTREFTVQGSWAEPKVERVERSLTAPLPELDPPAAAGRRRHRRGACPACRARLGASHWRPGVIRGAVARLAAQRGGGIERRRDRLRARPHGRSGQRLFVDGRRRPGLSSSGLRSCAG